MAADPSTPSNRRRVTRAPSLDAIAAALDAAAGTDAQWCVQPTITPTILGDHEIVGPEGIRIRLEHNRATDRTTLYALDEHGVYFDGLTRYAVLKCSVRTDRDAASYAREIRNRLLASALRQGRERRADADAKVSRIARQEDLFRQLINAAGVSPTRIDEFALQTGDDAPSRFTFDYDADPNQTERHALVHLTSIAAGAEDVAVYIQHLTLDEAARLFTALRTISGLDALPPEQRDIAGWQGAARAYRTHRDATHVHLGLPFEEQLAEQDECTHAFTWKCPRCGTPVSARCPEMFDAEHYRRGRCESCMETARQTRPAHARPLPVRAHLN